MNNIEGAGSCPDKKDVIGVLEIEETGRRKMILRHIYLCEQCRELRPRQPARSITPSLRLRKWHSWPIFRLVFGSSP